MSHELGSEHDQRAAEALGLLAGRGGTLAVAESLTGGMLAAAVTAVPGASAVLRGAVVAYATDLKSSLLGVPGGLLDRHGPVHAEVAAAMAEGACRVMGASCAAATTGVAGPGPADGHPAGTVHIAVRVAGVTTTRALALAGGRHQIRSSSVRECLELLVSMLREQRQ